MADLYFCITNWQQAFESSFRVNDFLGQPKVKIFVLYANQTLLMWSTVSCFVFSCMQPDCCVEVIAAGFYFKCKVTHLLSYSASMGTIQGVIIVLVYSVNVCQMDSAFAAVEHAGKGPPWGGKREKKKTEVLWFPTSVSLPCLIFISMLTWEMPALTKPEVAIVLFFLLTHTLRISCPSNDMRWIHIVTSVVSQKHQIHLRRVCKPRYRYRWDIKTIINTFMHLILAKITCSDKHFADLCSRLCWARRLIS